MPWSIFTQGGGQGAALTWAQDLLKKIGAPLTAGNEQFVYDWEVSEGGGGKYNPLNQGPVPGDPSLTTTGQQYGGGAADFASWDAGLAGAADYLAMPAYQGITSSLLQNDPQAARQALIGSPWAASHYGGGSSFSDSPIPGHASALTPAAGSSGGGAGLGTWLGDAWAGLQGGYAAQQNIESNPVGSAISGALGGFTHTLADLAIIGPVVLAAGAIAVFGFIRMTGRSPAAEAGKLTSAAGTAAMVAA